MIGDISMTGSSLIIGLLFWGVFTVLGGFITRHKT
jgi:hypothetical protein